MFIVECKDQRVPCLSGPEQNLVTFPYHCRFLTGGRRLLLVALRSPWVAVPDFRAELILILVLTPFVYVLCETCRKILCFAFVVHILSSTYSYSMFGIMCFIFTFHDDSHTFYFSLFIMTRVLCCFFFVILYRNIWVWWIVFGLMGLVTSKQCIVGWRKDLSCVTKAVSHVLRYIPRQERASRPPRA